MGNSKVLIVDYGLGNLFSIEMAVRYVGGAAEISDSPQKVVSAERLILPGVGAFGNAMEELKKRGLAEAIYEFTRKGRPLLGICLGMQLLMTESHEFGMHRGLDLIPGKVVRLRGLTSDAQMLKVPHIGWNTLEIPVTIAGAGVSDNSFWDKTVLQGIIPGDFFYFVHSFACYPDSAKHILSESSYGIEQFGSVVYRDAIYGCQFHPERSGKSGLHIYKNFISLT